MPKLNFVKKARKDNPVVKRGESYYWWKHAFGPKKYSKDRPRASQMTQSNFLSQLYALEENITMDNLFSDFDSLNDTLENLVSDLENLKDECQESLDNMPEHLQDTSGSGITLQERIDNLEGAIGEMESIEVPEEPEDWSDENDKWEKMDDKQKDEFKENWKKEQIESLVQSVQDAWPSD